jgi:GNAT superfamily N-acetyltransferase
MEAVGPAFSEEHMLADRSIVRLRLIRPEDASELRRGFERLSPASRYRRFLGGVTELSDEALRYLTEVDGHDHVAIVVTRPRPDGSEEGLGVARFIRLRDEPSVAEAAVTVLDDEQRKGLGQLLTVTLARAARERGIRHFRGEILADNVAVRELLRDVGADVRSVEGGRLVFDVALGEQPVAPEPEPRRWHTLLRAASTWLAGLVNQRLR